MRFLFPIIVIGALLASQIAFAESGSAPALPLCKTKALERRMKRLIRLKRPTICLIRGSASHTSSSASFSGASSSAISVSSSASSSSQASIDPLTDTAPRSQFLLLGETGPMVGAASVFIDQEPLSVTAISVQLNAEVGGLYSFLVYDADRKFLGTARLDPTAATRRSYKLSFVFGQGPTIERRQEYHFYVRPVLLSKDLGGLSNQTLEINQFIVEGNGVWSSEKYSKGTTEHFPAFVTARSSIVSVKNALSPTGALSAGTQRTLGSFTFQGRTTDPSPHIAIESLEFDLSVLGGVSVANVQLAADGSDGRTSCTVLSSSITCTVPDTIGRLDDGPRTLTLYGDITVPAVQNPGLLVSLTDPGSTLSPGAVTWNDGSNSFQWLPVESPVADGTMWK